jgi:integrase
VCGLRVADVHLESEPKTIRVREKGAKDRVIPVHPLLEQALRAPNKTAEAVEGHAPSWPNPPTDVTERVPPKPGFVRGSKALSVDG